MMGKMYAELAYQFIHEHARYACRTSSGCVYACFVLFERSMKLRETAIEQESLQAAYSFL